jgi:hypothetical protein
MGGFHVMRPFGLMAHVFSMARSLSCATPLHTLPQCLLSNNDKSLFLRKKFRPIRYVS